MIVVEHEGGQRDQIEEMATLAFVGVDANDAAAISAINLAMHFAQGAIARANGWTHSDHRSPARNRHLELAGGVFAGADGRHAVIACTDVGRLAITFASGAIDRSTTNVTA